MENICCRNVSGFRSAAPSPSGPAFSSGRISSSATAAAAKNDRLVILNFEGTDGDFQFASEEERAENVNIGMSVEKGNTQLRDAINTVVSALTPDQFNILMEQAIAVQPVI